MKLFKETEKSTFAYWFAHWRAFNLTAMLLGVWHPRFLLHDIEKPFLMFIWKDYQRVRQYHRTHSRHHWAYAGNKDYDYLAMVIDWECSRFSKADAQMTAYETYAYELHNTKNMDKIKKLQLYVFPILEKLNLKIKHYDSK